MKLIFDYQDASAIGETRPTQAVLTDLANAIGFSVLEGFPSTTSDGWLFEIDRPISITAFPPFIRAVNWEVPIR